MNILNPLRLRLTCLLLVNVLLVAVPAFASGTALDQQELQSLALQGQGPSLTQPRLALPAAQGPDSNCPAWQPPPSTSYRAFPGAGLYTFFDWRHLDPDLYPWLIGGHHVFTWRYIEDRGPGDYYWDKVDQWIASQASQGKQVGLGFNTYEGDCCGGNQVPTWFNQQHGAWPAGDGYVTCSWSNDSGTHTQDIPMYWTPAYLTAFEDFIRAAAERYRDDPRVAFVEISAGIFGETMPGESDSEVDQCLQAAGLNQDLWLDTVYRVVDIFRRHWQDKPLVLQYAPWYLSRGERRQTTDYAGNLGVGLKHNRLIVDHDDQVIRSDTATIWPEICRAGQYDPLLQFAGQVPLAWEGSDPNYQDSGDVLWSILNGLNKHPSYLVMGWRTLLGQDETIRWALDLAARYAGASIDTTPGVWVALRETRSTWYPQRGNFEFWLRQDDHAPGGSTVAEWNVTDEPWGRYARRTDAAHGSPDMIFDVDGAYIQHQGTGDLVANVVYLDRGTDQWELLYDAFDDDYRSAGRISKTNSDRWQIATFALEDAQLAGGQGGYDFRIRSLEDGDETLSFVEIKRMSEWANGRMGGSVKQGNQESADERMGEWTDRLFSPPNTERSSPSAPPAHVQLSNYPSFASALPRPFADPPVNDDLDSATLIASFPFRDAVDTTGATVAEDDPAMGCGQDRGSGTVWYRFTAPGDGVATVHTVGSDYDTVLAAWQGNRSQLVNQGCNDDGGWWSTTSSLSLGVRAGEDYVIEVAGHEGDGGGVLELAAKFSFCTYATDRTAVQAVLDAYGLDGFDSWIETVDLPNGNRCAITELDIRNQGLASPLPDAIGAIAGLQRLDLHGNAISGPLPATMGNLGNLQWLDLHYNQISGQLPDSLGSLGDLQAVDLTDNRLTSSLPASWANLDNLQHLALSNNQLVGQLPGWINALANLEQLWLGSNHLSGPIPETLGDLAMLRQLSLADNLLTDAIPDSLGNLARLENLYLEGNLLVGPLPQSWARLADLRGLYLDHNQLSGALPEWLFRLGQLEQLHLAHNQFDGPLPAELGQSTSLRSLVLLHNRLSGDLPEALGQLHALRGLYLSHNDIGGVLPASLDDLASLRRLDLSHTQLSGAPPNSLTRLALWEGRIGDSDLCQPVDNAFLDWLASVPYWEPSGESCQLELSKSGEDRAPTAGRLVYRLDLHNWADGSMTDVLLQDTLPEGVALENAHPLPTGVNGSTLTWQVGDLPATGTYGVTLQVVLPTVPARIVNQAQAQGSSASALITDEARFTSDVLGGSGPLPTWTPTASPTPTATPTPTSTPGPTHSNLGGYVWFDANGDGVRGNDEPGLAGVRVQLLAGGGQAATATTHEDGFYVFPQVTPGHYVVHEINPQGAPFSTTPDEVALEILAGRQYSVDFGDWSGVHLWLPTILLR